MYIFSHNQWLLNIQFWTPWTSFPIYSIFSYSFFFFFFLFSLLHAFIITLLPWPLSNCNLLASNLPLRVKWEHCGQGYLSCSPLWSCYLMSRSLRWFSVSLHYKVKFLLFNFKASQVCLSLQMDQFLTLSWLRYNSVYCVHT